VVLNGQDLPRHSHVTLLAFGDVNLGRAVGLELLKGRLEYPFQYVRDTLSRSDIVFVNLESQLSDRGGLTQHPKFNMIFAGPPNGAASLQQANISIVSTGNNHAFDFGMKALRETILNLQGAGVSFTGTSLDSEVTCTPAVIEKKGIRIGFLAYTQFVNIRGAWVGRIAVFDSVRAKHDVELLRPMVDLVVVSYHGGVEYTDKPSAKMQRAFRMFIDAGADIVLGHHPHYVQGIEAYKGKLIFYSLGNFVFYQPQLELTRYGLGAEFLLEKRGSKVQIGQVKLIPVHAGLQPSFKLSSEEERSFLERVKKLSTAPLVEANGACYIKVQHAND
jgi:poly-gamma-glutamate capsule biosynthesis protein CapA/YwtB (metallophosphatase superfamily)